MECGSRVTHSSQEGFSFSECIPVSDHYGNLTVMRFVCLHRDSFSCTSRQKITSQKNVVSSTLQEHFSPYIPATKVIKCVFDVSVTSLHKCKINIVTYLTERIEQNYKKLLNVLVEERKKLSSITQC